eukprot:g71658.t1
MLGVSVCFFTFVNQLCELSQRIIQSWWPFCFAFQTLLVESEQGQSSRDNGTKRIFQQRRSHQEYGKQLGV